MTFHLSTGDWNMITSPHHPSHVYPALRTTLSRRSIRENVRMPPPAVKTISDLLFWQYAKIISESAGEGKANYGFIMNRFKNLQSGKIQWSSSIREYVKEHERPSACVYCASSATDLTLEHMLPKSRGGPDIPDNAVWVCGSCNARKGSKRLYEWYGLENRNELPRIAEGKYLKLLFSIHESRGTLAKTSGDLCSTCDLGSRCPAAGKLSVYCLEGNFLKL